MGLLDSIVSGGMNLIGGILNNKNQNAANATNQAFQEFNLEGGYLSQLVANAKAAGINPLAVLGQTQAGSAVQVGSTGVGDALEKMGSDVSRAALATADKDDQASLLDKELKMAQIDKTYAESAAAHAEAARTFGQPGTPPGGKPDGSVGHPIPMYSYYDAGDGSPPQKALSREFAGTQFGPTAYFTGARSLPGIAWDAYNDLDRRFSDTNARNFSAIGRYMRRFMPQSSDYNTP